jgi:hypothetical protein
MHTKADRLDIFFPGKRAPNHVLPHDLPMLSPQQALAYIECHGAVLASARGPLPRLTEAIVGAPIRGSWWSHPLGKQIFVVLRAVEDSPDIFVSKLVGNKVTFVHRRLWPGLVRLADRIGHKRLAQIREEHTASGKHATHCVDFPAWVPRSTLTAARGLDEAEAATMLETLLIALESKRRTAPRKKSSAN